jgi:hypothetical protein
MANMNLHRIGLATALFSIVLGAATVAAAKGGRDGARGKGSEMCEGKEKASTPAERAQRQAERFQKADKNHDGFLTKDEVGDKRWEHMSVADANGDGKLTKAEIAQAHQDGKLGRHHGKPNRS